MNVLAENKPLFNIGKLMQTPPDRVPNKLVIGGLIALMFGVVGSAYILYYLGVFSNVSVKFEQSPEYRIAFVENTGPYNKIDSLLESVSKDLEANGITNANAIAIFLDDPSVVEKRDLRSKVGYVISDFDQPPHPLQVEVLQSQEVVQATFHGSPLVGSFKAYKAMKQWCADNGYIPSLPGTEIYRNDGTVEYYLPIKKR